MNAGHIIIILLGNASHGDGFDSPGQFPAWERLKAQGMELRQWIANPIGSHSNYAALFGEYPFRQGIASGLAFNGGPGTPTSEAHPTLAHAMRMSGRDTACFGKLNIGRVPDRLNRNQARGRNGLIAHLHGFDSWLAGIPSNVQPPAGTGAPGTGFDDWERWDEGLPWPALDSQWCDEAIGDEAVAYLLTAQAPSFVWVGFAAAHGPLSGTPPASTLPPGYVPGTLPPREEHLLAADVQVQRILDGIDLGADTVLLYATTGSGPKGVRDERILCPAVIAGPDIPQGEQCDSLVTPRDLWHHMGERFGLPAPYGPDSLDQPYAYCDWTEPATGTQHRCVRTTRFKLAEVGGVQELYDLTLDPDELSPIDPDAFGDQQLVARLRGWLLAP